MTIDSDIVETEYLHDSLSGCITKCLSNFDSNSMVRPDFTLNLMAKFKFHSKSIDCRNFSQYRWFVEISFKIDSLSKFNSNSKVSRDSIKIDVLTKFHSKSMDCRNV